MNSDSKLAQEKGNDIFLSTTMTGNLQLLRLKHIGYIRYNSTRRQWEAQLSDKHVVMLKRNTNAQTILNYHPDFIQISQSIILNVDYLASIKDCNCILLSPFDTGEELQITPPYLKELRDKYQSI